MSLKKGRVRISTWFDDGSDALIELDAVCKRMGTTRGEGLRFVALAWLEVPNQPLPVPRADKLVQKKISEPSKEAEREEIVHKVRVNDDAIASFEIDD